MLAAARWACLAAHAHGAISEPDCSLAACADAPGDLYFPLRDLAARVVAAHSDTDALAVERITAAIEGKTGATRTLAAYRANAGVLLPGDVERIAAP